MSKHTPGASGGSPAPLNQKLDRIVRSLTGSRLDVVRPGGNEALGADFDVAEEAVDRALRMWRARTNYLQFELLCDPAWGMLLELLLAEHQGRRVSISRLSNMSGVPTSAAVRWIKALERAGLAVRRTDAQHPATAFVELSPQGRSALQRYFHEVAQPEEAHRG